MDDRSRGSDSFGDALGRVPAIGRNVAGFQLWVNLPQRDKMTKTRYQEIPCSQIPKATSADGLVTISVIAGEALGQKAVIETRTPIIYLH